MKCLNWKRPKFPIVRKCCFCVPIKRGIIIYSYINLVVCLLSLPLLVFLLVAEISTGNSIKNKSHFEALVLLPLNIVFIFINVILIIVLLVGTHKKKRNLMKVYFYGSIFLQLLSLCLDLVYFDYQLYVENAVYLTFLGLDAYMLFLVFNAMYVIDESTEVQYVSYHCHQHL